MEQLLERFLDGVVVLQEQIPPLRYGMTTSKANTLSRQQIGLIINEHGGGLGPRLQNDLYLFYGIRDNSYAGCMLFRENGLWWWGA